MDYFDEDYEDQDEYIDEDEYKDEEENRFQAEVNVFERVNRRDNIDIDIDIGIGPKKNRTQETPIERFVKFVNAIALELTNENYLSEDDVKYILEKIRKVNKPEYKNPTAYILGYIATNNGGNKINKDKLIECFNLLDKLVDKSVTQPDIIRYARLWMNL
jgi:hypothetical protein